MNADILLDAIGLIDERFIVPQESICRVSWRRTLSVALAAVLILALCVGTLISVVAHLLSKPLLRLYFLFP